MMVTCHPFAQILKLSGLMCFLKVFKLNLFSPWNTSILKLLYFYMLVTVLTSLKTLSVLFKYNFCMWVKWSWMHFYGLKAFRSCKNLNKLQYYCDAVIYLLAEEHLVPYQLGLCGNSCILGEVVYLVHICGRLWQNLLDLTGSWGSLLLVIKS